MKTNSSPISAEFEAAWFAHRDALLASRPELNDPEHPLVKAANALCSDPVRGKFFQAYPDGLCFAVEIAEIMALADGRGVSVK
jgi:hypothetical protein